MNEFRISLIRCWLILTMTVAGRLSRPPRIQLHALVDVFHIYYHLEAKVNSICSLGAWWYTGVKEATLDFYRLISILAGKYFFVGKDIKILSRAQFLCVNLTAGPGCDCISVNDGAAGTLAQG